MTTDVLRSEGAKTLLDADVVAAAKSLFEAYTISSNPPSLFTEAHVLYALGVVSNTGTPTSQEEARASWLAFGTRYRSLSETEASNVRTQILQLAVELHYSVTKPPMFDIFAHLSANEMFFIDGDSLVTEALTKPLVDWELMQPVQVQFFVQRILDELLSRGARFEVIFFDSSRWIWKKAPQKLLIRELVKDSLLNLASKPQRKFSTKNFASWQSAEFKDHLEDLDPEFILMTDGEKLAAQTTLQDGYVFPTADGTSSYRSVVEDESIGNDASVYYHCFMLETICCHTQVVFSSRLVFKDNAVVAFVVRSNSERFAQYLLLQDKSAALAKAIWERHTSEEIIPTLGISADQTRTLETDNNLFVCFRERVVAGAVLAYLQAAERTAADVALCKVLWICTVSMSSIPAKARAQSVSAAPELVKFMSDIAPFVLATVKLSRVGAHTGLGQEFDPIDGHLLFAFVRILSSTAASSILSEDITAAVDDVWISFIGGEESIVDAPIPNLPTYAEPARITNENIRPIKHELVTSLAKNFSVRLPEGGDAYPSGLGAAMNLKGWDVAEPFDQHNDVMDVGKMEDEKEKARLNAKAHEKQLKIEARRAAATQQTAESLGAALFLGSGETLAVVADKRADDKESEKDKKPSHAQKSKKSKYVRTTADRIREENNLRLVRQNNASLIRNLHDLMAKSERFNETTRQSDRDNLVFSLKKCMNDFQINETFINENEVTTPEGFSKVTVWRALVALAKKNEREVALDAGLPCFENAKTLAAEEHKVFTSNLKIKESDKLAPELLRFVFLDNDKERQDSKDVATRYIQQICLFFVEAHYLAALEVRTLRIAFHEWQQEREAARLAKRVPENKKAVKLFILIHKAITRIEVTQIRLPVDDVNMIRSAVRHLEFSDAYNLKVDTMIGAFQDLTVGSLPENLKPRYQLLNHAVENFQLCEMGELLERPVPPFRDHRVSFKPDEWQKDLLDIVDNRGSALVCAPTSAGKTFISFYCMKAVLMNTNDRIVVYVAPIRALINQAVADVCARFSSKKYMNPGLHVYGALGGDEYHHDHDTCQVLITLPEVFETMLLSPKYVDWAKRIDYVIFDEIHSMESSGNGPVWERILALTTAPFIALSATLGETTQLCSWLNRIQSELQTADVDEGRRDYSVTVIPRNNERIQRWNDIEKYVYQPPVGCDIPFDRTNRDFEFEHIRQLHPLSTVTLTMLRGKFPPDLSLVPKECVALYGVMKREHEAFVGSYSDIDAFMDIMKSIAELNPTTFFVNDRHIVQRRAREYEAALKAELLRWAQLGVGNMSYTLEGLDAGEVLGFREDMTTVVQNVLSAFQQHLKDGEEDLKKYSLSVRNTDKAPFPNSLAFVKRNIFNVLRELRTRDRSPTIVFSFESEDCESLLEHVVSTLEDAEERYRSTSEFQSYVKSMENKREKAEERRRLRESRANQEKTRKGGDDEGGRAKEQERNVDVMVDDDDESYEIPAVLPEFAFFGRGEFNHLQFSKIEKDCEQLGADLFIRALRRGICIHHAGVPGKLRTHSERMFRSLYCSVIFATETLALGVHSPCRSVVLAGDHILLNTTQFRQMMGRAGRRGLDNLGHLIFLGVSLKKVNRVMTSDMMVIKGHVQVDGITQLRLLQLHDFEKQRQIEKKDQLKWKESIRQIATRLFANPLYFLGRERMGGNMESFQVRLLQAMLRFFQSEGLHFAEADGTSSLGSLITTVTHVFRNAGSCAHGFTLANLITANALKDTTLADIPVEEDTSAEAQADALAYALTINTMFGTPMELHRSSLRNPEVMQMWEFAQKKIQRVHRVALAPLKQLSILRTEARRKNFLKLLSAFYEREASYLSTPHDCRLPFMTMKFKDDSKKELVKFNVFADDADATEAVVDVLLKTATPFAARHPIAAVSGCGDDFRSVEDMSLSLRDDGLFADMGMFPVVEFVDGSRHENAQLVINGCVADFIRCGAQIENREYRRTLLQSLNGLSQSESYHALDRAEKIVSNLIMKKPTETSKVVETLRFIQPQDSASASARTATSIISIGEKLSARRRQIDNQAYLDRIEEEYARINAEAAATKQMALRARNI